MHRDLIEEDKQIYFQAVAQKVFWQQHSLEQYFHGCYKLIEESATYENQDEWAFDRLSSKHLLGVQRAGQLCRQRSN